MSRLVPAYRSDTGKKLAYYVHEHVFDNPVYRGKIRRTPKSSATRKTPARRGTTPEGEVIPDATIHR